jgi:hypothetical protein
LTAQDGTAELGLNRMIISGKDELGAVTADRLQGRTVLGESGFHRPPCRHSGDRRAAAPMATRAWSSRMSITHVTDPSDKAACEVSVCHR